MALKVGESATETYLRLEHATLTTAATFLSWLRGPVRLTVTVGPSQDQTTKLPTGGTNPGGTAMQLHDNEQADVTVTPVDAKGFESADVIVYEVGDPAVVTVVGGTDDDSHTATFVAGNPGSTVVTISDPSAIDPATGNPLFVTIAVDTLPAAAVALAVTEGTPVLQP